MLNGGIAAWYIKALPIGNFNLISVHDLKGKWENEEKMVILDVRDRENGIKDISMELDTSILVIWRRNWMKFQKICL